MESTVAARRRVLVTGAGGLLGRAVCAAARRAGWDLMALDRAACDITDSAAVAQALAAGPDAVINCAAYTKVDLAEREIAAALAANTVGPALLAAACAARGTILLQISTDYVFDGCAARPYEPDDATGPRSVYGRSKRDGEAWVRALAPRHWIVRTSGLFGAGGSNFVDAIVQRLLHGEPLRVVDDQVCDRTYVVDLADALLALAASEAPFGTYHVTNAGGVSWCFLARVVAELLGVEAHIAAVTTAEWGAAAPRPAQSVLSNAKYLEAGLPPLRSEREAVAAYLASRMDTAAPDAADRVMGGGR